MQVNPDLVVENPIDIDTFKKTKIQVVEILEVSKVKGADKLLKFKVSLGDHVRQILSAIAEYYPNYQDLVGSSSYKFKTSKNEGRNFTRYVVNHRR